MQNEIPNGKVVSADGPKEEEIRHEMQLREWLSTTLEPEEESARRRSVLERINYLVRTWIYQTMVNEFLMQESAAKQVSGRIFATGSYRYNVHTSGSDIDIVLIAPARITRDHFFNSLAPRLKNEPWVKDLNCIRDTRVPIIAMVCDGIDIDLSFGSIRQDCVPEVITDDLLLGLDEQSVLSCNAVRVAHNIMALVPDSGTFRQTLRFVKAWGKFRGIYSNTFGFPSGIGWAILVAFVAQCYPNQNAAGLVTRFFRTYHTWFKPNPRQLGTENRAIYLTASMRAKTQLGRCWDPRESKSDAMALFPVLTPALPYSNACFNVTSTNLKQLCAEFKRGQEITTKYLGLSPQEAQSMFGPYGIWSKLLEKVAFFGEYQYYLHIQIECKDPSIYQAYVDGVESKIRILWAGNASSRGRTLEDIPQLSLRLNPKRYEDPDEVAERSELLQKRNHSTVNRSTTASTRESGPASRRSSVGPSASSTIQQPLEVPADFSNSAHYFIGMVVDTSISSAPINLAPSIATFHQVIRQLPQFKEGGKITVLPKITVCDIKGIPDFVLKSVGYEPPVAAEDSAKTEEGTAEKAPETGDTKEKPSEEGFRAEDLIGVKREREDAAVVDGKEKSLPSSSNVKSDASSQKNARLDMEEIDIEEALGLDF